MVEFRLKSEYENEYLNLFQENGIRISRSYIPNVMIAFHKAWFEGEDIRFAKCDNLILEKRKFETLNGNIRNTGSKNYKISVEDMGFLLFYLFTNSILEKDVISEPDSENNRLKRKKLDKTKFSIEKINQVLNVYFDTDEVSQNSILRLKKFIICISEFSEIGICKLEEFDNKLYVRKLDEYELEEEKNIKEDQILSVTSNQLEQNKVSIKDYITSNTEQYDAIRKEINNLKLKADKIDTKESIASIEKAVLEILNYLQQKAEGLSSNTQSDNIEIRQYIASSKEQYDAILSELNDLKRRNLSTHESESSGNSEKKSNIPAELNHLRQYENGRGVLNEIKIAIKRRLPSWLKNILIKEEYSGIAVIGDDVVIKEKIEFYIPLEFEKIGKEYDDVPQYDTKKGLVEYLWKGAINGKEVDGRTVKYFFIFGGVGQGKSSLLAKLYVKYARFMFDFYGKSVVACFKIDEDLEYKLGAFKQQVRQLEQHNAAPFQYRKVVLLDALDEDLEANYNLERRLGDLKSMLDDFDRIIITCRTQFFDSKKQITNQIKRRFGDKTQALYITKFQPNQINKYLRKRYKYNSKERKIANELIEKFCDKKDFISQPLLLNYMGTLVHENVEESFNINYKSELYEYIIKKWQNQEGAKKVVSNTTNYTQKVYDVAHQVAINIYKKTQSQKATLENLSYDSEFLSNQELTNVIHRIDKDASNLKRRSVFMRNSIGDWFFVHKSFLAFFTGHAAYQIPEFDMVFEYHAGFNPLSKKDQDSASFFYLELMWLKIQEFNNSQKYHTIFCKLKNGMSKTIDQVRLFELPLITILNQRAPNHIDKSAEVYALWAEEQSTLVEWIRCLKNLEQSVKFDFDEDFDFHISMIGNMKNLKNLSIYSSITPINLEELIKFKNIFSLRLWNTKVTHLHLINELKKIQYLYIWRCHLNSTDWNQLNLKNDIEYLELKNSEIPNIDFLRAWHKLKSLNMTGVIINDISPILELENLQYVTFNDIYDENLDVLLQLVKRNKSLTISLNYSLITDEVLGKLFLIKKHINNLMFYGIHLHPRNGSLAKFFDEKIISIDKKHNSLIEGIKSLEGIEKLQELNHETVNIYTYYREGAFYIRKTKNNWEIKCMNESVRKIIKISSFKKFHFEALTFYNYHISDFENFQNFENLKTIGLEYIPSEISRIFNSPIYKKSLHIQDSKDIVIIGNLMYGVYLENLENGIFEELKLSSCEIKEIPVYENCEIKCLELNRTFIKKLENIKTIKGLEILRFIEDSPLNKFDIILSIKTLKELTISVELSRVIEFFDVISQSKIETIIINVFHENSLGRTNIISLGTDVSYFGGMKNTISNYINRIKSAAEEKGLDFL